MTDPEPLIPPIGSLTNEELACRAQAGSLPCFTELVARFEGRLFNFLYRRVRARSDAEDLTQETFLQAWRKIRQYNPRWRFSTWLFTIANRLAIAHRRSSARQDASARNHDRVQTDHDDPAQTASNREQSSRLWQLAGRLLNDGQRAALWLRFAEDMSVRDIAAVLGRTQVHVRVMLFRARHILAEQVGAAARSGDDRAAERGELSRVAAGESVAGGA